MSQHRKTRRSRDDEATTSPPTSSKCARVDSSPTLTSLAPSSTVDHATSSSSFSSSSTSTRLLRSHPLRVKPLGNRLLPDAPPDQRAPGLGCLRALSDDLMLNILQFLSARDLFRCRADAQLSTSGAFSCLQSVSRAFYLLSREEELYKAHVLRMTGGHFLFQGCWRGTCMLHLLMESCSNQPVNLQSLQQQVTNYLASPPVSVTGFYSDTLFASHFCASLDLSQFSGVQNMDRLDYPTSATHVAAFERFLLKHYLVPNRPFILRGIVSTWPAYRQWTHEWLLERYGDVTFKVGAVEMTLNEYWRYAKSTLDEAPLYLFDSSFIEKCPDMVDSFRLPSFAQHDLLALLESLPATADYNDGCEDRTTPDAFGAAMSNQESKRKAMAQQYSERHLAQGIALQDERKEQPEQKQPEQQPATPDLAASPSIQCLFPFGSMRPAHRWILIGPTRSGSTFHKDPNHTSAWNGLISGRKRWLMYPPDQLPLGVFASADQRDIITPLSVMEWFANYYRTHQSVLKKQGRASRSNCSLTVEQGIKECANEEESELKEISNPLSYEGYSPVEGVCNAGDLVFIPNGWYHLAVNEEFSVALTANFVSNQNLLNVSSFLKKEGNAALDEAFHQRLEEEHPSLLQRLRRMQEQQLQKAAAENVRLMQPRTKQMSLWESMC